MHEFFTCSQDEIHPYILIQDPSQYGRTNATTVFDDFFFLLNKIRHEPKMPQWQTVRPKHGRVNLMLLLDQQLPLLSQC